MRQILMLLDQFSVEPVVGNASALVVVWVLWGALTLWKCGYAWRNAAHDYRAAVGTQPYEDLAYDSLQEVRWLTLGVFVLECLGVLAFVSPSSNANKPLPDDLPQTFVRIGVAPIALLIQLSFYRVLAVMVGGRVRWDRAYSRRTGNAE